METAAEIRRWSSARWRGAPDSIRAIVESVLLPPVKSSLGCTSMRTAYRSNRVTENAAPPGRPA